jgi:hypothetical protein
MYMQVTEEDGSTYYYNKAYKEATPFHPLSSELKGCYYYSAYIIVYFYVLLY